MGYMLFTSSLKDFAAHFGLSPKVEQKANLYFGRLQIVEQLLLVLRYQTLGCFEFQDDLFIYNHVGVVLAYFQAMKPNWNRCLLNNVKAPLT